MRKLIKLASLLLAITIPMTMTLSACSGQTSVSTDENDQNETKVVTIRFAAPEGSFKDEINAFAQGFTKKNANVKIQYEPLSGSWEDKLLTMVSAGTAPDVFWCPDVDTPKFASRNVLLELDPYFSKFNIDKNDIYPTMLQTGTYNGKIYMMPRDYNHVVTFYNKTLFDKASVPYPKDGWTWDEFIKTAKKLVVKQGNSFVQRGCDARLTWSACFVPLIIGLGGSITNIFPGGTSANFNTPETIKALTELKGLVDIGVLTNNIRDDVGDIYGGNVAMTFNVRPIASTVDEKLGSGKWDVVSFPVLPAKHVVGSGASGYSVYKGSANPELAAKLVFYIISDEGQQIFAKTGNSVPVRISLSKDATWRSLPSENLNQDAFINNTKYDILPLSLSVKDLSAGLSIDTGWSDAIIALLNGEKTPAEAAKLGQEAMASCFKGN